MAATVARYFGDLDDPTSDVSRLALSHSNGEEMLSATLEEDMLAEARSYGPYFSYRRPELYGSLTEPC